jgi:hypothetical protein
MAANASGVVDAKGEVVDGIRQQVNRREGPVLVKRKPDTETVLQS